MVQIPGMMNTVTVKENISVTAITVTNMKEPGIHTKIRTTQAHQMIGEVAVQVPVNHNKLLANNK